MRDECVLFVFVDFRHDWGEATEATDNLCFECPGGRWRRRKGWAATTIGSSIENSAVWSCVHREMSLLNAKRILLTASKSKIEVKVLKSEDCLLNNIYGSPSPRVPMTPVFCSARFSLFLSANSFWSLFTKFKRFLCQFILFISFYSPPSSFGSPSVSSTYTLHHSIFIFFHLLLLHNLLTLIIEICRKNVFTNSNQKAWKSRQGFKLLWHSLCQTRFLSCSSKKKTQY